MKLIHRVGCSLMALLMMCSILTSSTVAQAAAEASTGVTVVKNDFIQISMKDSNGRFSVRTVEGQPKRKNDQNTNLTFTEDDTSFTTFRINGTEYIFGNKYSFTKANGKKVESTLSRPDVETKATGDKVIAIKWSVEGVEITQRLTIYASLPVTTENGAVDPSMAGTVLLEYSVQNNSGADVQMGSRVLLDAMLSTNDGPSYQNGTISESLYTTERSFYRNLDVLFGELPTFRKQNEGESDEDYAKRSRDVINRKIESGTGSARSGTARKRPPALQT